MWRYAPAGQHRQRLVGRGAAEVRPQVHGVAGLGQKPQVRPVGAVHQQQNVPAAAKRRQARDILGMAQVVGAGAVEGCDVRIEGSVHVFSGPGYSADGSSPSPSKPLQLHVQQRRRGDKGSVDVPGRGDFGPPPPLHGPPAGQVHHGPHRQGRALGGIERRAAIELPGVFFTLPKDSGGLVEAVGPGNLGQVPGLRPQDRLPLVARHMEPQGVSGGVAPGKVHHRRLHASFSIRSTARKRAHSIRLRKSSQPISYTPRMEPVAW